MPAVRLSSRRGSAMGRRRSSLANSFAKAGTYGYSPSPPATTVTFAPNVTPTTYNAPSPTPSPFGSPSLTTDLPLPIFPPCDTPAPPPTRKRQPPGKRRSQGYIPRPPNAFMLFRADFVRQKHVPGTIETNHGSLSKIIGNCWRSLPLDEKHLWEVRAKQAKAEHKQKYPDYKFRPVHNKQRGATAPVPPRPQPRMPSTTVKGQLPQEEDDRRCEEVAALLLQGKKGEELAAAVQDLDKRRHPTLIHSLSASPAPDSEHNVKFPYPLQLDSSYYPELTSSPPSSTLTSSESPFSLPQPLVPPERAADPRWRHRRSSSVPLPNEAHNPYTFPPFFGHHNDLTLPPIGGYAAHTFSMPPPPPSSADDSLAGMPVSIADSSLSMGLGDRVSFSWMNGTGSSFSYPRPSFSFGFGDSQSVSYGGTYGGAWHGHSPVGRRPSSAQAFLGGSSATVQNAEPPLTDEELPDLNPGLFPGFSFGAPSMPVTSSTNEGVSPFDAPAPIVHAPQPIDPRSALEDIQFQPNDFVMGDDHQSQSGSHPDSPFEFAATGNALDISFRTGSSMDATDKNFEEISYANEFV
ncbi:HMG box domain-containing protein [Mycena chlorophos]|uniref:HMG box domain-containing protein n=1 Tax=Mycena chlorophos TaxID=658473 RepID=A0A8H6WL56_MYCCL|nr:HMG box domain-containing protein [Mycena chlorophos]